jgi:hypothetical protein
MMYLPGLVLWLVLLLACALLPGAVVGTGVGWVRGRPGAGLGIGAVSGTVGGVSGFMLYQAYLSTLPYEDRRQEWGPYRHILDPPPLYVVWLSIIGGSLLLAILCATVFAVFVSRPEVWEKAEKKAAAEEKARRDAEVVEKAKVAARENEAKIQLTTAKSQLNTARAEIAKRPESAIKTLEFAQKRVQSVIDDLPETSAVEEAHPVLADIKKLIDDNK